MNDMNILENIEKNGEDLILSKQIKIILDYFKDKKIIIFQDNSSRNNNLDILKATLMQEYALYQFNNTKIEITNYMQQVDYTTHEFIYFNITTATYNIDSVKEIIRYLAIAIKVLEYVDDGMQELLNLINNPGLFGKYYIKYTNSQYAIYDYSSQNVQNSIGITNELDNIIYNFLNQASDINIKEKCLVDIYKIFEKQDSLGNTLRKRLETKTSKELVDTVMKVINSARHNGGNLKKMTAEELDVYFDLSLTLIRISKANNIVLL